MRALTDQDLMPFGKYRDRQTGKVPADYLDWLAGQEFVKRWPQVEDYIDRNRAAIDMELREKGIID